MANEKKVTSAADEAALRAEIARLTAALATSQGEVTEAKKQAMMIESGQEAVPTGQSTKVVKCKGYKVTAYHDDGRPILRPEWHEVEVPTYWYTVDMPAIGGTDIKLNGKEFYHGQTYEVTEDELRTLKDIVFRLWQHEHSIHQDNEKAFRGHYDSKLRKFFPRGPVITATGKKVLN